MTRDISNEGTVEGMNHLYDRIHGNAQAFVDKQFGDLSHPDQRVNELFMKSTVLSYVQGWLDCRNEQRDT